MNTSMDSLSIEIQSVARDSSKAVDTLIAKLDQLRTSLQNVIKESNSFSQLKDNLEVASKAASVKSPTTKSFSKPLEAATDVGFRGDDLGNSNYAKLKSTITSTNGEIRKYILNNNDVLTVTKRTRNDVDSYTASLKKLSEESKNTSSRLGSLKTSVLKTSAAIGGGILAIKKLANTMSTYVKNAADYEESMNLFMVTLGDRAEEANAWVEKFSNALYLDPANVRQYMGAFNSLTKGLGVGADKAYLMSQNLTQLTYDLASFKNLDFDTAFRKLQSAISGEIEPLRNVGVALSQNTLQELADELKVDLSENALQETAYAQGIKLRVAEMSEAQKAQLRYIQIMRSTTEWQTDMGRTLVTPANAVRILKQQFTLLSRAIGSTFIPILMAAVPYIMVITQALTKLAQRLADLLGYKIQDVDYSRISTGLSGISDGIEDIGDEAGKTAKKLNTMLAPFDELNVVQNKVESAKSGIGADDLGADLGLALPEYDALANLNDKFAKNMDKAREKLKGILAIVGSIGGAFATWKISKKLLEGLGAIEKLTPKNLSFSVSIIGIANFLSDINELRKWLDDILDNGPTFRNVTGILSEFAGGIGDVFTILGRTKLGGSLKVIQGIGEITSAVSDIAKNGINWDNANDAIRGLTNIAIGVGLFTGKLRFVGAVTAIQGFTSIIEELHKNWDAIKKGDWSGVDKATLMIGAIQVLGGVLVAFDTFNKIKKTTDIKDTATNMSELSTTTSKTTSSLKDLAKNLGFGILIIGEIAVAAGLFVGAIWVLGKELEQVGIAWDPVLKNGPTIAKAIGLGTALLVGIGLATALLGKATISTGGSLPLSIALGTAILIELGVATALFIAEVWAIGKGLDQIRIAWQPVLDNGETVKSGIAIGTSILIAIGVATAALGAATVASAGTLPIAIGLGTAMLVELGVATEKFIDSISKIARQLNDQLTPQLARINENSNTVTRGLENYTDFLKRFATIIYNTTKVNVLASFSSFVTTLIGWFSKNPIEKLAKDVNKTYNQSRDLNYKLSIANPELQTVISLLSDYLKLIKRLDSLTSGNKISNISGNIFVNMKDAGKQLVNGFVDGMNSRRGSLDGAVNNIYNAFNNSRATQIGRSFGQSIANGINAGIKSNISSTIKLSDKSGKTANQFTVKAYAEGGYPRYGDFFVANENGPEMIGKIGNRSAVANNDQIESSLTNALLTALNNYDFGGSKSPTTIYIGNKKVYEGYGDYVNGENDRYGTNTIRI